jgi:hypothetical protein
LSREFPTLFSSVRELQLLRAPKLAPQLPRLVFDCQPFVTILLRRAAKYKRQAFGFTMKHGVALVSRVATPRFGFRQGRR